MLTFFFFCSYASFCVSSQSRETTVCALIFVCSDFFFFFDLPARFSFDISHFQIENPAHHKAFMIFCVAFFHTLSPRKLISSCTVADAVLKKQVAKNLGSGEKRKKKNENKMRAKSNMRLCGCYYALIYGI